MILNFILILTYRIISSELGVYLLSSTDTISKIVDIYSGNSLQNPFNERVTSIAPRLNLDLIGSEKNAKLVNLKTGSIMQQFDGVPMTSCTAISPDLKYSLIGFQDGQASLQENLTGIKIRSIDLGVSDVTAVDFSKSGQTILIANSDGIRLLDFNSNQLIQYWTEHRGPVLTAKFIGNNIVLSSSSDGTAKYWSPFSSLSTYTYKVNSAVNDILLSNVGNLVYTASIDGIIRVFTVQGSLINFQKGHEKPVMSLEMSWDKSMLISASVDSHVILWRVNKDQLVKEHDYKGEKQSKFVKLFKELSKD